jgi:hypothetical protein
MSQLATAFNNAVNIFNAPGASYNGLRPYYHPNIIMKRFDDPTFLQGATNVIDNFNTTQLVQLPQFLPSGGGGAYTEWPANTDTLIWALIYGTGTYQDNSIPYTDVKGIKHSASAVLPANYTFIFSRKTSSNFWLLTYAVSWKA